MITCKMFVLTDIFSSHLDEFVQCGFPGLPFNAIIFPADQSQFSDGDIVQYECEEGWALLGPASRMCQSGAWTGTPPICSKLRFYKSVKINYDCVVND